MRKESHPVGQAPTPGIAGDLPDAAGRMSCRGWAPRGLARFDAAACAGDKRLRQWEFFTAMNERCALNVTLADIRFATLCSVDAIELATGRTWQAAAVSPRAGRYIEFGRTPQEGADCRLGRARVSWRPLRDEDAARIDIDMPRTLLSAGARGSLTLTRPGGAPYLAHVMPLDAGDAFFYQCKIPGYRVAGDLTLGGERFVFGEGSYAIRDWGRGLWPARLRWFWGAGHGSTEDGRTLWANFGGGFGDTSAASENLIVIDGVAHKLDELAWKTNADGAPVAISESGGRLSLTLAHDFVQKPQINVLVKSARLRKAYGHWHGTFRESPDAPPVAVKMQGFGEQVHLKW